MEVITLDPDSIQTLTPSAPCVLALGFFDGVHMGHQRVIQTARTIAQKAHLPLSVMTFDQHASAVFPSHHQTFRYLTTIGQKADLMAALGVDRLYVVRFTRSFASLSPQTFVDDFLVRLGAKHVVAGFDYTFGRGGTTSVDTLPALAAGRFTTTVVAELDAGKQKVSSTRIRHLIATGQLRTAEQLLGHPYQVALAASGDAMVPFIAQQLPPNGCYQVRLADGTMTTAVVIAPRVLGLPMGPHAVELRFIHALTATSAAMA
ncbi:FAD synthetase family protein [Lacticaseibacillus daqingensis]|uniref:FAD synthetase family protein n=1 Tax=Lacticaseibacillus daqingensis TaxID=2486014 RepID=UPI000F7B07B3|nr:FAD synthetase family protein [Lacticaseibacillus daqingensis]